MVVLLSSFVLHIDWPFRCSTVPPLAVHIWGVLAESIFENVNFGGLSELLAPPPTRASPGGGLGRVEKATMALTAWACAGESFSGANGATRALA